MYLSKLNLHPASYYEEYIKVLDKKDFKAYSELSDGIQTAIFNFRRILRESGEILAILSANYFERFADSGLFCIGCQVGDWTLKDQQEFIYKCLEENKPWEYYYPEIVKELEEARKTPNCYYD